MKFSDETVKKVAMAISDNFPDNLWSDWTIEAKAALSSLTLADLMQVEEVRALVDEYKEALQCPIESQKMFEKLRAANMEPKQ